MQQPQRAVRVHLTEQSHLNEKVSSSIKVPITQNVATLSRKSRKKRALSYIMYLICSLFVMRVRTASSKVLLCSRDYRSSQSNATVLPIHQLLMQGIQTNVLRRNADVIGPNARNENKWGTMTTATVSSESHKKKIDTINGVSV